MKRIGDILTRHKTPVTVESDVIYKQVTIRTNYKGVILRGTQSGSTILTKSQWRVSAGQFILSRIDARNGAFGIIPDELEGAIVTNDFLAFDINEAEVEREFFNVFLQSPIFLEACIKASRGNTNRKRVDEDFFLDYAVNLPPIAEQHRLIQKINAARSGVATAEQEIALQEDLVAKLRQAIFQEAITGKLTADWRTAHSDVEPASQLLARIRAEKKRLVATKKLRPEKQLPPIPTAEISFAPPEGWEWCRLIDVSKEIHYGFTASADSSLRETRLLRITDIQDDHVDWETVPGCRCSEKERRKYQLDVGDILIARTGGTVGKSFLVDAMPVRSVFASYLVRVIPFSHELAVFMKLYLGSPCYWFQIGDAARGAQPNVSGSKLKGLYIPLPPLREQTEIVVRVERLMERCRELEAKIARSRAHAAALLQAILREAFAPSAALGSEKPVTATETPKPEPVSQPTTPPTKSLNRHFARAVLSAEIVHRLHAEPTFGRVKHQKIFHLCEHIARIEEIAGQYHREAAGPLDNRLIYANEGELKKQQWYAEVPRKPYGHAYAPLPKAGSHQKYMDGFDSDKVGIIERLIELMRKWDTDRCEIFCTAYAAWNDLLIWKKEPTEEAILHQILDCWNPAKKRFPRERWLAAIKWMREHDFAPTGFGKPTAQP